MEIQQPVNYNPQMPPPIFGGLSNNLVEQPRPQRAQDDPHATRWAYMPPLQNPALPARESGQQSGVIEVGKFVAFADFTIPSDSDSLDSPSPVKDYEVTAMESLMNAVSTFGAGDNQRGFVEFDKLAGLKNIDGSADKATVAGYAYVTHPEFKDIKFMDNTVYACPEGLEACPTCRLKFLSDSFISDRFNEYEALRATYNLPELDYGICEDLRDKIRFANQTLLDYHKEKWQSIKGALNLAEKGQKGGLNYLTDDHHYIRRTLHESAPEERQAQVVTSYGAVLAEAMNEANQTNTSAIVSGISEALKGSQSDDKFLMLMERMEKRDEQQAQFNQQILERLSTPSKTEATEPAGKSGVTNKKGEK